MRRRLIAFLAVGLLAACTGSVAAPTTVPPEWAAEAVAWREALYESGADSSVAVLPFWDPDIIFEDHIRGIVSVIRGRKDMLEYAGSLLGDVDPPVGLELFLSADEALDHYLWKWEPPVDFLDRIQVGPNGITFISNAGSVQGGRSCVPEQLDFDAIEALGDSYVAFWNGTSPVGAVDLYAPDTRIDDTLLGSSLVGREEIAASPGRETWPDPPPMTIVTLPEDRGPAVYNSPSFSDPSRSDEIRLVVDVDDGSGCPGLVAVALGLDYEGRVVWERRYHEVESARRCLDPSRLRSGWWEGMEIPEPLALELTGKVGHEGVSVDIYNGRPESDVLVAWGLERFSRAGLAPPLVTSVAFLFDESRCDGFRGYYTSGETRADISLCFLPENACADEACTAWTAMSKFILLHEYAHSWMDANVSETTRAEFLDLVAVPRWADLGDPHDDRGVERAADIIALGLIDDFGQLAIVRETTCEVRESAFRLLTGAASISPCES
jgi:hypothetical protein